jgi:O-6-methylguanine DNA methyltransferase
MPIPTPEGAFIAQYSERGLCGLKFPPAATRSKRQMSNTLPPAQVRRWHAATSRALQQALAGRRPTNLPPLDLSSGTAFQRQVWQTLRRIGWGQTLSYGRVARAIGSPKAVRAVGGACGANPIPVFVPCHRVLASNKGLGGYSGGLHWKRALLKREGIRLPG